MSFKDFLRALEELRETRDVTPFVDQQHRVWILYSGHQMTPLSAVCFFKRLDLMDYHFLAEIARDLKLQASELRRIHRATENRQTARNQSDRTDLLQALNLQLEYR